jgi:phosphoenolpyruvate carboxykinase (ATP)
MHSSANCKVDGSQASVLFGLSGTGKTTLSADASRELIGDDEIIWSKRGLSNIEGGCYAKLINLDPNKEPEIYKAANKQGSILENVCYDDDNQRIDFYDDTITENTRGSYSIESLEHVYNQQKESQHPKSIVFLTADAFGALPAIAKLDSWQTQYHFISGYTAKVAGTEIGIVEPEATFSACFGAPFMPRPSHIYATLLAKLVEEHKVNVWLLNTGWVKGYGNGERFPIDVSRKLLDAIQTNQINLSEMQKHPVFGFNVPTSINGIDSKWLEIPSGEKVFTLAKKFIDNAERNKQSLTEAIVDKGGPKIMQ